MKTREEWQRIVAARKLLGLGERATLAEIKSAYRRMSKKHHPDMEGGEEERLPMHRITEAYQVLLDYCETFRFPLEPDGGEAIAAEDWWMERFGQDPLWGPGSD